MSNETGNEDDSWRNFQICISLFTHFLLLFKAVQNKNMRLTINLFFLCINPTSKFA